MLSNICFYIDSSNAKFVGIGIEKLFISFNFANP